MQKDLGIVTMFVNRHHLNNFSFGFDFYQIFDVLHNNKLQATITQFNFIFFNVTFTRWHKWE